MDEPRMDAYEAIAYGRFTAAQIHTLLLGLDPELDGTLRLFASRLESASDALEAALLRSGEPTLLLHRASEGSLDTVHAARETIREFLYYASGSRDGYAITSRLLQGESMSTTLRRTPLKLLSRLEHMRHTLSDMSAALSEHQKWSIALDNAREDLAVFDAEVRAGRATRRGLSSDASSAWTIWQRTYAAAKYVVLGMLAGCDKVALIREVFDDLAEETPARLSQFPVSSLS